MILATTKTSLIAKFKKLEEYCNLNNIKLQPNKCCFLTINSKETDSIVLERGVINNKNEFLYLGSIITNLGNVTQDVKTELKAKEKKFNKFFAFLAQNKEAPLPVKEKVLESCILSAVIYNCETWGDANLNELEMKYRDALKRMLGVRKSTCNEFLYVELGKPTLTSIIYRRQLKFYKDCMVNKDLPMQRFIIRKALDSKSSFIKHYLSLSRKYEDPDEITKESLSNMVNTIREKANLNHSRYKSYLKLNPSLTRSGLYNRYLPYYKLREVTRLKVISHNLEIDVGRYQFKNVNERLCSCGEIETEEHFLMQCCQYTHIRQKYLPPNLPLHVHLDSNYTPDLVYELQKCRDLYR